MGAEYWYRVVAYNSFGDGTPSAGDNVTIDDVLLAPPGDLTAVPAGVTSADIDLTAPTDDPGGLAYTIQRAPDSGGSPGTWANVATGVTTFPYTSTSLVADTRYHFRAKPTKSGLADGPWSRERSAVTLVDQPQSVGATHDTAGCFEGPVAYRVDVTWSNDNSDGDPRDDVGTEWEYKVGAGAWTTAGSFSAGATSGTLTVADQTTAVRGRYVGGGTLWSQKNVFVDCPI